MEGIGSRCVETRNLDQASSDARPRDNHPFLFRNHAGRTALCPEMSVAPAAVQHPAWVMLSLAGGTTIRSM